MAVITNIDKFRDSAAVELNGARYNVRVLTMAEYINNTLAERLEEAGKKSVRDYCRETLEIIKERSSIPDEHLDQLTPRQLEAVLYVIMGMDADRLNEVAGGTKP